MSSRIWTQFAVSAAFSFVVATAQAANVEEHAASPSISVVDRKIAYVLTDKSLALYQSKDGKEECPDGLNNGPREEFKILYPDNGTTRKLVDTQLAYEGQVWDPIADWKPMPNKTALPFREAKGKVAIGLNLDGKIGPNDFTGPNGEPGIDNQLFRVVGCVASHRSPDGVNVYGTIEYLRKFHYNRVIIALTDVDSLVNDSDLAVTIYRGLDPLLSDAVGDAILPGGTQRIDYRYGKKFTKTIHGKITNGVLTTEPTDVYLPDSLDRGRPSLFVRDWRLNVKVTPDTAQGLMGGYTDIEGFQFLLARNLSTHHRSYGQESIPSEYQAMRRLADAYPDPKTGANTAISSAWTVKFKQVFILPNSNHVAQNGAAETKSQRVARSDASPKQYH